MVFFLLEHQKIQGSKAALPPHYPVFYRFFSQMSTKKYTTG
jgi:hypothetical protein